MPMNRVLLKIRRPMTLEAVCEMRHLLEQVINTIVTKLSLRRRILLCFSEAATNLVAHTKPDADHIGMDFGQDNHGWWLEIFDNSIPWDPTIEALNVTPDSFELIENGRGISLLHSQCDLMEYHAGSDTELNRLRLFWEIEKQTSRPTVLIVEDNYAMIRLHSAYLMDDFELLTAENGQQAIQILKTSHIDLVLSDIHMPEMSGLSLREQLNSVPDADHIPFIFLTSVDNTQIQQRASSLGIVDYLLKPVNKTQLIQTIHRVLGRSQQIYRQLTERIDKRITSALTPKLPDTVHNWRLSITSRHTGIGGGDLLLHRDNGDQLMLVLLDIMGHDDSAKFFAYAYGGYLRGLMQSGEHDLCPSQLLERLSDSALQDELLSQVTLTSCVASLFPGGKVTLASAGHPPPLHINKAGARPVPVGGVLPGLQPATDYQSVNLQLSTGERIALYTDGLFESATDSKARNELEERITTTLADTLNIPINESLAQAMSVFDELAGTPPRDDALLLLIEPVN